MKEWAEATGKEMHDGQIAGRYEDPMLHQPGRTSLTDPTQLDATHLPEYIPVKGSPVIDAGLDLEELFNLDPGRKDILGTAIPSGQSYDIGAVEYGKDDQW